MEKDNIISLASYRERKPALLFSYNLNMLVDYIAKVKAACGVTDRPYKAFANVLNVPESEDIWPGDAAELFYPELFACRLSGIDHIYDNKTMFDEHKRCETLRLCSEGRPYPLMDYFEYDFYRCLERGAFPSFLFGDDGDDEEDSMNSELLLTQLYMGPEEIL